VYTAQAPPEAGEKKYDESAAAMIALLRYGSGVPWYRLCGLERNLGIPLPVATQREITAEVAVPLQPSFPAECRFVLETLGEVFGYDEEARARGLSPEERLHFHQEHSAPLMEKVHTWSNVQLEERKVEPARAPVGLAARRAFQGLNHKLFHLIVAYLAWRSGSRFVV
jgi:hypothetical protein